MAHGAKVGAQQRSSACEDSEKSRRSSDTRQYRYWGPVLEKFVKGTAAGHLVNLTNPVAQDFGAQALCREHMHDIAADDMKIYLGDRLLWRVFTYDLYMKIVLGFLSKVFTYDQGTKPAALRWSQKAPFFLTRKKVIFLDTKKFRFFAQSYGNRGQPKKHSKKT